MVSDDYEPSDAFLGQRELIFEPLLSFIDATQAVVDLERFLRDSAATLADAVQLFTEEAMRTLARGTEAMHREAGELIHTTIHEVMDATREAEEAGRSPEEVDEGRKARLEALREGVEAITGDADDYWRYSRVWNRIQRRPNNLYLLSKSLLISAVSDFEVLVSNLIRAQLTLRPAILGADEQRYSLEDLIGFETVAEFRANCAERYADSLMRGGLDAWLDWFGKRHKIVLTGVTVDNNHLVEIFQRRHLLVHNGGVVNTSYLTKVARDDPPELGTELQVGPGYLLRSADCLTTSGVKLACYLWRDLAPTHDRPAIDHLIETQLIYDSLLKKRYAVAEELAEWALSFLDSTGGRLVVQVNLWIARKARYGVENIRSEVEEWEVGALSSRFRLAKLALLDEDARAYELVRKLLDTDEMDVDNWLGWPLLEGVRRYEAGLETEPIVDAMQPAIDAHQDHN